MHILAKSCHHRHQTHAPPILNMRDLYLYILTFCSDGCVFKPNQAPVSEHIELVLTEQRALSGAELVLKTTSYHQM